MATLPAGDILPRLPDALKAKLFAIFDLVVLWNKPARQAIVHAELTEATLWALPALLDPRQDGYHDTATPAHPAAVGDLDTTPIGVAATCNHGHRDSCGI